MVPSFSLSSPPRFPRCHPEPVAGSSVPSPAFLIPEPREAPAVSPTVILSLSKDRPFRTPEISERATRAIARAD